MHYTVRLALKGYSNPGIRWAGHVHWMGETGRHLGKRLLARL